MSVKPILFNTEMVRAILDGRKTVTRRGIKDNVSLNDWKFYELHDNIDGALTCGKDKLCAGFYTDEHIFYIDGERHVDAHYYTAPYRPGDILYVRETWSEWTGGYVYKAWSSPFPQAGAYKSTKWHPSIHMPKEAARIWLKVTDVRVERLLCITEEQAIKEGFEPGSCQHEGAVWGQEDGDEWAAKTAFIALWDSTIPKKDLDTYGWDANPWVWVIEFERCEKPEEVV